MNTFQFGFKERHIILMDGGTGRELRSRGVELSDNIWSATGLVKAPDVVFQIHYDYIQAGSDIITTNSYGVIRENLVLEEIEDRFEELLVLSCELANEARRVSGRREVLIAGSIPPLKGSYRPDLVGEEWEMKASYTEHVRVMAPYVDLFLCETMSTVSEGRAAAKTASGSGKPVWVAWTLQEKNYGRLRSGETIAQACNAITGLPVSGTLVNCCSPESVEAAIPELRNKGCKRIGGYANTFTPIPEDWVLGDGKGRGRSISIREELTPDEYALHARKWILDGANVIGGCCGTGPEHIRKLRQLIDNI